MVDSNTSSLGFLTVLEHESHGLFGGYLLLNPAGRPLEFHCTAPVKANRAQEILYGPTLQSYLCGEHIGKSLVGTSKLKPALIVTDTPPMLEARRFTSTPLLLVERAAETDESNKPVLRRVDGSHSVAPAAMYRFELSEQSVAVASARAADREQIERTWSQLAAEVELAEPFGRIREAILEAQK